MINAICLITIIPKEELLEFYDKIKNYDIFVIVDNNDYDLSNLKLKFPNFNFVQIDNNECIDNGFQNTHLISYCKNVIGWDKVIYKMCQEKNNYRYMWFVEDDVFIPHEKTLLDIDYNKKYESIDLIANTDYTEGKYYEWLWPRIVDTIKFEKPYYCGMMCAIRVTKNLLEKIEDYARTHKTLFFLEAFFPTMVKHYGLNCLHIDEIKTITYCAEFDDKNIQSSNLYHPMKNIERHSKLRELLYLSSSFR
jgi:hypothetical protein